eukprot:14288823-Alexandrium_andersonii.AAC.1
MGLKPWSLATGVFQSTGGGQTMALPGRWRKAFPPTAAGQIILSRSRRARALSNQVLHHGLREALPRMRW